MEPFEQLRDLLEFYREGRGRGGLAFAEAWWQSVERVCRSSPDGAWWRGTFAEQREAWERAYNREPALPHEDALRRLLDPDGSEPAPVKLRVCAHCHGERGSMEGRPPDARYCDERCRRDAAYQRERRKARPTNATGSRARASESASEAPREPVAAFG